MRDSGIVLMLLNILDEDPLFGHPVVGARWEGFAVENLVTAVPTGSTPLFYRTSAGAEIDLLLEIPGHRIWAIEIKQGLSARPEKSSYTACEDLKPARRFVVNAGTERYAICDAVEVIGVNELASILAAL